MAVSGLVTPGQEPTQRMVNLRPLPRRGPPRQQRVNQHFRGASTGFEPGMRGMPSQGCLRLNRSTTVSFLLGFIPILVAWAYSEILEYRRASSHSKVYDRFISALEEASRDMLPIPKDKALRIIYNLLKSNSEQEQRLLSALVNKLGDHENKSASNADYHMSNLLSEHPNMKSVVISEVDSFLFRPRLNLRAKYHAVCPVTNK